MAIPDRARAQPKFCDLGLGEPFIANICGKWLGLGQNGCVAAISDMSAGPLEGMFRAEAAVQKTLLRCNS
jgi:hypothetical protein